MSTDKSGSDLDRAMQDALASVENREKQSAMANDDDENTIVDMTNEALSQTKQQLEAKSSEAASLKDQLLRLGADFENLRKRSHRENEEARKFGIEKMARDVLPVIDNLERALQHAKSGDPVVDGVRMVAKQFLDVLAQYGVRAFESVKQPFDPERHEALSQVPTPGVAVGTIVAEMQRGYMIHDRLLRAAQVAIAAPATTEDEHTSADV
jgi:molecular chaperone GrpE